MGARDGSTGETDLGRMLATLTVQRVPGTWTFVTLPADRAGSLTEHARAVVVEDEGTTLVLPVEAAEAAGLPVDFRAAWLTLEVHSSLAAVGLTAALSAALADEGISANVIAGFHHDHLLVPADEADRAVVALHALRGRPEVRVRAVTAADTDVLWSALYQASHSFEEEGVEPHHIRSDPALARYIEGWGRRGDLGVVAEVGGAPVGAAWVRLHVGDQRESEDFVDDETPELAVAVLAGWEGAGIGSAMLAALLDTVDDHHPQVVLSVRDGNPAVRLYERLGFAAVGTITNRVGTRSLKMVRPARAARRDGGPAR